MSGKIFAVVGNWGFVPAPKGITTYEYDAQTGDLKLIETIRQDIPTGQLWLDQSRNMVYAVNECGNRRGEIGGGGSILAFRLDPDTGKLTLANEKDSLSPEPSYICLDKERKHLLVCHCADPGHVTKIRRDKDGNYTNEVLFDDTCLVLFRVNDDGSIGDICDIAITKGTGGKGENSQVNVDPVSGHTQLVQVISRLHCIVPSPNGEVYVSCDKGMDRIYTWRVDRDKEKLVQLDCFETKPKMFPRYAAFHPSLPVLYVNNEFAPILSALFYDRVSGKMTHLCDVPVLSEDVGLVNGKPVGAQDILIAADGKTLYCSLVGVNSIAVLKLDVQGIPKLKQVIACGGEMPRGLQFSPDGRFLFSGNMLSCDITTLEVKADGTLAQTGRKTEAVSPSAIKFFVV